MSTKQSKAQAAAATKAIVAAHTANGGAITKVPAGAAQGAVTRNSQTAAALKAQAKAGKPAKAPAQGGKAKTTSNGIGKGWQGSTAVSRMALPQVKAYHAYLAGIAQPNARQLRHLARCNKALANLQAGATYFGNKAPATATATATAPATA